MQRYLILFLAFLIFQSCGKRVMVSSKLVFLPADTIFALNIKKPDTLLSTKLELLNPKIAASEIKLHIDELNFNFLKAKSKIVWKSAEKTDSYTLDIRMKKDSLIWVNISQSGFTGATGLFSRDRVQLYQKIDNTYFSLTYDSLSVMMGFRIDYSILQSLIVGNQPYKKNNSRVIRENENIILKQQEGRINIDNLVGPNRKLKKLLVNDVPTNNKLTMDFEEFKLLNKVLFPFSSQINLDVRDKQNKNVNTLITIKYSKVELLDTPLEFPFRVPAKLLNLMDK